MDPVPVTFNYFTTDSDGFVSDGAVISIGFPQLPSPPEASVGVGANEDGVLEEDTQGALHFTATPVESDDTITAITIEGFPVGPDGWLVDAGSVTLTGGSVDSVFYNSSTGELTILVTGATPGVVVTGTVDVTPNADSDVDVGLTINATATDEGLSATSSNGPTTVGVDAILDEAVRFVDGEDDDSEPDAIVVTADESYTEQDIQLGGDIAEVFSPFGQNDGAGDTNETGELTIVVTGGLPDGVSLSSFDGELVLDAGSTDTYTLTGTASELEAIADSLFVTVPEGFGGGFDGTLSVSFEDPAVDAIEVLGNNVSSSSTTFSVNIAPGEDIDFESLDEESVETDGSVNIELAGTISISDADGSEQFTSVEYTFNGLPAGTTAFGGVLVGNVLTVTLTAGELPASYGLTLPTDYSTTGVAGSTTNNGADITFDVAVSTNEGSDSESGTITVGVEGDINVEVATIAAQDETDAVVTFTLSDKLTVEETDADTSEQVTSVTVTLSGVPEGSVMTGWTEVGVDSGHYTWTGTSTAGVPDVGIAADWSGTVTGNVAGTTDEGGADNKNFSLVVDSTPDTPVNDVITVEEESIPSINGNDENDGLSYTINGTFSDNADWGTDGFGGIVSVNGVIPSSNVITVSDPQWTLTVNATTGDYTFTLLSNISSTPFGDNLEGTDNLPTFNVIGQDGNGSQIGFGLEVGVVDDIPAYLNPTTSHLKDAATSPDVVQLLNFAVGADGVEKVVFDTSMEGTAAIDSLGNELTFNGTGEALFVHFSDDNTQLQFVTKNTDGSLNTANVKFFIELSADGQTYSVHSEGVIINGTAVTATNLSSVGGGNVELKAISNIDGTSEDVVMTTEAGETVNTNANSIGIGTQNAVTVGEAIRFDFTNGEVTGNGGNAFYQYGGSHNLTNAFTQQVYRTTAGTSSANITISAILADADDVFYGDTTGETFVDITSVKVYSGTLADVQAGTATDETSNVTITLNADGSASIAGLQEKWIYQIETTDEFSAVTVGVDVGNIKLGVFSYGIGSDGLPIELDYDVIGTDTDGDSVTGSLGVNLYPDGATIEGGDTGDILNGTNSDDYIIGRDGDDDLFGLDGDDLLIGGFGDDELTGGSGEDSFLFSMAANSGDDIIKDFEVNTDKLNFIDVLDVDNSGDFNLADAISNVSDSGVGGDISVSLTNGGSVTLEGIGTGAINDITSLQAYLGATNITVDESQSISNLEEASTVMSRLFCQRNNHFL